MAAIIEQPGNEEEKKLDSHTKLDMEQIFKQELEELK